MYLNINFYSLQKNFALVPFEKFLRESIYTCFWNRLSSLSFQLRRVARFGGSNVA